MSPGAGDDVDAAGSSARLAAEEAAYRVRDLAGAMRREEARRTGFTAAALSEPRTAAALSPLADQGWRVLHDRLWPGSSRANVDHLAIGPTGVAVIDTKHWSRPVQVREDRLWCGDSDCHDTVEDLLRLVAAVEELLEEVSASSPGDAVGLSPVHVLPVLVFTGHAQSSRLNPCVGRVRMTTLRQLPTLIARQPRGLSAAQVGLVGEYLAREMHPTPGRDVVPHPRPAVVAVPVRPEPSPRPEPEPDPAAGLFDRAELDQLEGQLAHAANAPLVEWMGFLHPSQVRLVRRSFTGPARVRGPAGTGKSVVLLHRAAWLAATRPGRILVSSYVRTLPRQLRAPYRRLAPDTVERVDFLGVHELARGLLAEAGQRVSIVQTRVDAAFTRAWERVGTQGRLPEISESRQYWRDEIDHVIKGRGLRHLVDYEHLDRRGRGIPLSGPDRLAVWDLLTAYTDELEHRGVHDYNDLLSTAVDLVRQSRPDPGWSAVLVDEVQDLPLLAVKLCALLGGTGTDGLFLVGDGQQAIYPGGFNLAEAKISVLGRASVLRVNYRNTQQVLDSAHQLVADHDFYDLDTTTENGTRDVEVLRTGPPVTRTHAPDRRRLALTLTIAINSDHRAGIDYGEMAVLTGTRADATYLREFLTDKQIPVRDLANWDGEPDHHVKIDTIHRSKGLDFVAVYHPTLTTADNNPTTPDQIERRIRDLRQRFVAHTRARDRLWIGTIVKPHRAETATPTSSA